MHALLWPTLMSCLLLAVLYRAAGFGTVNQHPGFLSLATIWLREHNRRAAEAIRLNPSFGDEEAFQYARKWVCKLASSSAPWLAIAARSAVMYVLP